MLKLLIIASVWFLFFSAILHVVSQQVSLIGVYHDLGDESFFAKFRKILKCNIYLSFPIIFSFNIVMRTTITSIQVTDAFLISLPITLMSLLTVRVLSNPSEELKPVLCNFHGDDQKEMLVELHKERMLSFIYSFICRIPRSLLRG